MIGRALRAAFAPATEQRAAHVLSADEVQVSIAGQRGGTASGTLVSNERALSIPVVYAGIARISEAMRQMPLQLLLRDSKGWQVTPANLRIFEMLCERPNEEQSSAEFFELQVAWMLMRGDGFAWKERDGQGRVTQIWPIRPDRVQVTRDLLTGRKVFHLYANSDDPAPLVSGTHRDLIHFRGWGTDPLRGMGVVQTQRELVARTRAEEDHQGNTLKNQVRPSGVLQAPAGITPANMAKLREGWAQSAKAGGTPVLNDGVTWQGVSMTAADTQFIEQRQMTRQEWAMVLRLPPSMLLTDTGGSMHYDSASMDGQTFVTYTMMPWVSRLQDPLRDDIDLPWRFTGGVAGRLYPVFDTSGFTKADAMPRAQANAIAVKNGWKAVDEIRNEEGLPVRAMPKPAPKPAPTPADNEGGDDASPIAA